MVALSFFRKPCRATGLVRFLKYARFWREHNVFLPWSVTRNLNSLAILQYRIVHFDGGRLLQAVVIACKKLVPRLRDMLFGRVRAAEDEDQNVLHSHGCDPPVMREAKLTSQNGFNGAKLL